MAASKDGRACSAQHHPPAQPLLKEKEEAAWQWPIKATRCSSPSPPSPQQMDHAGRDATASRTAYSSLILTQGLLGFNSLWCSTDPWDSRALGAQQAFDLTGPSLGSLMNPLGKDCVWHSLWWKLLFLEDQPLCPCSLLGQQCMQGWGGKCCTVVDTKALQLPAFSPIWPAAIRHGHDSLASLDFENLRSSALTLFFPVVAAFRNSILDSVLPQNKGRNFITDQWPQVNHPGAARTVFPEMSTILAQSWDTSHLLEPQPFCVGIWGCRGSSGTHGAQLLQAHGMDLGLASHIPNKSVQDTYTRPRRMNTHSPWRLS